MLNYDPRRASVGVLLVSVVSVAPPRTMIIYKKNISAREFRKNSASMQHTCSCISDRRRSSDGTQVQVPTLRSPRAWHGRARRTRIRQHPRRAAPNAGKVLSVARRRSLPLPKAFLVQRVAAVLAKDEGSLGDAVHPIVADGAVVIRAGNPLFLRCSSVRSGRRGLPGCARIRLTDVGMSHRVGCKGGISKYVLQLSCQESSGSSSD